jgi:hypothetical protein
MITIQGLSQEQRVLADLLWACGSQTEVDAVLRVFGHNARVVYELIVIAAIEEDTAEQREFSLALDVLDSVK